MGDPMRETTTPPGPEFDARLFEAFFGPRSEEPVPEFSTHLETAWILLQRLLEDHRWVEVVGTNDGTWICRVADPRYLDLQWLGTVSAEAPTAPLAICRAALRIVEAGEGERTAASA